MPTSQENFIYRNVIGVSGNDRVLYAVISSYFESDPVNSTGQILRFEGRRDGKLDLALDCQDPLSALWVSPSGVLWAAAANGSLWTTSPGPSEGGEPIRSAVPELAWRRVVLPPIELDADRPGPAVPNIASLWGFDDKHLYAATFQGVIYMWDGVEWKQMAGRAQAPLVEIHGSSPKDLYAVGLKGTVISLQDETWKAVALPAELPPTICRGVRVLDGTAYVCTRSGHLLVGGHGGFRIAAITEGHMNAVALLGDRILTGSTPGGASEWTDGALVPIKPNFSAIDAYEVGRRVFFIEGEQKPHPRVVEYDPRDTSVPWGRREFPMEPS